MDTFFIKAADVGELHSLRIGHNNKGLGAAWHLAKVKKLCHLRKGGENSTVDRTEDLVMIFSCS